MLIFDGENLKVINDAQDILVESVLQELRLWKGEKEVDVEAGIDYIAVLNKETFLKTEVENVLIKYRDKFNDIEIGDIIEDVENEVIRLPITFYLSNDGIVTKELSINNS